MLPTHTFLSVAVLAALTSCAGPTISRSISEAPAESEPKTPTTGAATIAFRADRLTEVAIFRVRSGLENVLRDAYFARIMPVAQEYGAKPLGSFSIETVQHGTGNPTTYAFFEWPDLDAKHRFERDPRFVDLRRLRNGLLEELRLVYLRAKADATVELVPGHVYEIFGAWLNRKDAERMNEYFSVAAPFVAERGAKFPAEFDVVGGPDPAFVPHAFGFIDWPSRAAKDAWFGSEEFRRVGWKRAVAVDRLFVLEGRVSQESR